MMFFSPEPFRRLSGPLQLPDVPAYRQVSPQLAAELRRARRYEHHFAAVVLSPHAMVGRSARPRPGLAAFPSLSIAPATVPPTIYFLLGSYLRNTLRETDILTAAPEALSYAVFLAETDRACAEQAVARLREGFHACAGVELRSGVAEFPDDGLTIEDLLDRAWDAWHKVPASDIVAPPSIAATNIGSRAAPEASHG